jgi:hypothetical protein
MEAVMKIWVCNYCGWTYQPKRWFPWIFAFLLIAVLSGCAALARYDRQAMVKHCKEYIVYFQDPNTGLCFAALEGMGLTTIPCDKLPKKK